MASDHAEQTAPTKLGRYELIGLLATGGMAEIHLARLAGEAGFEKIVVVKRLLPELCVSKAFVSMFLDEGKLVARLDHPNICEVHELGRDGTEYFLVMPYLDGVPATELIAQPRDPDRIPQLRVATGIIAQACAGLHHAHDLHDVHGAELGLVHRDVSPSNLFVTTKGVTKVLDFGIAKVRGATETEVGTVKGKTQYMAPEQLLGEPLDRRCDVFALGTVLYELATHQRLFKRASDYLAARAILEEEIPRADEADTKIPAALADVIAMALAREPANRYASARELGKALETAMLPHGGIASATEIAVLLAEHHAEQLTAQRTRQARVMSSAVAKLPAFEDTHATALASKRALLEAATTGVKASPIANANPTTLEPMRVAAPRRRWAWAVLLGAAIAAFVIVEVLPSKDPPPQPASGSIATSPELRAATERSRTEAPAQNQPTSPVDPHAVTPPPAPTKPAPTKPINPTKPAKSANQATHPSHPKLVVADVPPAATSTGFFSINASPYATIFVDDRELGVTPFSRKPLPAGLHHIKAVRQDGEIKTFDVTIPSGGTAPAIHVVW